MSVSEAKHSVTSTEFLRWIEFFKQEWQDKEPLLFYLAQIAHQVYMVQFMFGGDPKLTIDDFLLSFSDEEQLPDTKKETEDERRQRISENKAMFTGALALAAMGGISKNPGKGKGKKEAGDRLPRQRDQTKRKPR